jgi:hypothetical protein
VKTGRFISFAALAALALAPALPAQERDRRDRSRDRDRDTQQSSSASTRPAPAGYLDRYAVLEQRNIFARDRSKPQVRTTAPSSTTQPTRRSLEESLILRGIAMEDWGFRAYVEDLNTNGTLKLSPGDALGRARVVMIALDAIALEQDGRQFWIEIGHDLTGKRVDAAPVFAAGTSSASATTSPATLPANVDLNDPSLTHEQRMKLRRQLLDQQGR